MAKSKRDPNVLKQQQEARRLRREEKLKKKRESEPTLTCVEVNGFVYKEELDFEKLSSLRNELSSIKKENDKLMKLAKSEGLRYSTNGRNSHFAGTGSSVLNDRLTPILRKLTSIPKSILKIEKRYRTRLNKIQYRLLQIDNKISSLPKSEVTELARLERLKVDASSLSSKFEGILNVECDYKIGDIEDYQLPYLLDIKSIEDEEKIILDMATDMRFNFLDGCYKMKDGSDSKASKTVSTKRYELDIKKLNLINKIVALFTNGSKDVLKKRLREFKHIFQWALLKLKEQYDELMDSSDPFHCKTIPVYNIRYKVKTLYRRSYSLDPVHMSEETLNILPKLDKYITLRKNMIKNIIPNNFSTMSDFQSLMIYRNSANVEVTKEWRNVVDVDDPKLVTKIRNEVEEYINRQVTIDLLETNFGIIDI